MREEHEKMQMLQGHPNILQSYGTVSNGKLVSDIGQIEVTYNILELAENGTFLRYIKETGGLGEHLVKFHFMQMWNAVAYIHSQGMAHLDIKLENILLDSYFNVKIADLGIAVDVSKTEGIYDGRRGTTWYMAPEINYLLPTETYDAYRADIYSLGMCLYVLVFGEFPVKEESDDSTFDDTETIGGITGLKWSFDWKNKWQQISLELQDLLGNMLSMEPEDRPSLQEILESKWILPAYDENMPLSIFVEMERRKELISEKDTSN
jgi:serine/threonine protein kinase